MSDFESGLQAGFLEREVALPPHAGVGILMHDPINRWLVEGASIHLDLVPEMLTEDSLNLASLSQSLRFYRQSTKPQAAGESELLERVLDLYVARAEQSEVKIERRERPRDYAVCLESEIRQVLNNLVRNVIESMGVAGGRLLIRTRDATYWRSGVAGVTITIAERAAASADRRCRSGTSRSSRRRGHRARGWAFGFRARL